MKKYVSEKYLKEQEIDLSQWGNKTESVKKLVMLDIALILFVLLISTFGISIIINRMKELDKYLTDKMRNLIKDENIEVYSLKMGIPNAFNRGTSTLYYTVPIKKLLTEKQLMSILCHEYGHYKEKHVFKQLVGSITIGVGTVSLIYYLIREKHLNEVVGMFLLILSPMLNKQISNMLLSRPEEYIADSYATKYGLGKELIDSFKKLQKVQKRLICKKIGNKQCDLKLRQIGALGTHPSFKNRIENILKNSAVYNIIKIGDTNMLVRFLQKVKARLTGN